MVQLANRDGVVSKNYDYDAFGNERSAAPNDTNPFRYAGEYLDLETNNYYLRARYYSPTTGRFLQEDTVRSVTHKMPNGQEIADPLRLNLYTDTHTNPIYYHDPTGHFADPIIQQLISSPTGQQLLQQLQTLANQAGMSLQNYIANNLPQIQYLVNQVGNMGSAAYDYVASGKAWNDVKSGVQFVGDKISSGANSIGNWFQKTFGGGGSASPGDPDWNGGFKTFNQLKSYLGSAGKGNEWHHIVEQSQIKKSGFDTYAINNVNNIMNLSKDIHNKVTGYYNSIDKTLSSTMRVRDWLAGQSFEFQYKFGLDVIKRYGG